MKKSIRDFLKLVLKSTVLVFRLVDMVCKDRTIYKEISFIDISQYKYRDNVAASIPIHTDSGIFIDRIFYILFEKDKIRGFKNHSNQFSIV